jgi:hypothetical protein
MQGQGAALRSFLFGPNILLSTLFSNTLSRRPALNARDQVSHPYRTKGRILTLYILFFMFLDSKREEKIFGVDKKTLTLMSTK